MAIDADRASAPAGDFWNRLRRARFVLIAGAIVFAALVALGPLTPIEGLIAFAQREGVTHVIFGSRRSKGGSPLGPSRSRR